MSTVADQVVEVDIVASTATPTLPTTNIQALYGYHTAWTDYIRTYSSSAGMVSDGLSANHPLVLMAESLERADPHPSTFKVIRGASAASQVMTFVVTDTGAGHVVGLTLLDAAGVEHDLHHTVASETAIQIATAIVAIGCAGATLTNSGGASATVTITVTAAGSIFLPSLIQGGQLTDTSAAPAGLSTDLDNAANVDPNFYGLNIAYYSAAAIAAAAGWVQSNKRMLWYNTFDFANLTVGTGIMGTLKAAADDRCVGLYTGTAEQYSACEWLAGQLVEDPGAADAAYKTLDGVTVDGLTTSQINAIVTFPDTVANNGNCYIVMANVNVTIPGMTASGMFADIRRGIDALAIDIQLRIIALRIKLKKWNFNRKGIGMGVAEIEASLDSFIASGFILNDPGFQYVVTAPDLSTIPSTDISKRILRTITFTAYAQDSIQYVKISGTVNA